MSISRTLPSPTANDIVQRVLSREPHLGAAAGSSLFDALKDEPSGSRYSTDDWATLAQVELENQELLWEVAINSEAASDLDEDDLAFLQCAMTAMEEPEIRTQVGQILAQHAERIRAELAAGT